MLQLKQWLKVQWNINKGLVLFIMLMVCFRSAVADWNDVPTGSMKPTIIEGDRININKLAYDVRVPITQKVIITLDDPARGDIVIFESKAAKKRLVKRIIGVGGDVISMRNNRLIVNNTPLRYTAIGSSNTHLEEDLLGIKHQIQINKTRQTNRSSSFEASYQSFDSVYVPDGYYFAMGDNRDNSADSRIIGLVPRDEIIGRSESVALSLNYDNYYLPRVERFFKSLD